MGHIVFDNWRVNSHFKEAQSNSLGWTTGVTDGIKCRYCDVMKALIRIILDNRNPAECGDALKFQNLLQEFEFVLILLVLAKVMSSINVASTYLQSKDADLLKATQHLNTAFEHLSSYQIH